MKKRLKQICQEAGLPFEETEEMARAKLCENQLTGKGGNTWITKEGWDILSHAIVIPEIVPKHYKARVIKPARNPRYVFAKILDGMKVPVLVPGKMHKRLTGKNITIEEIEDTNGRSYRLLQTRYAS
tara:strand:- start:1420 stop:1800 length:381 start_codon:yes stop_codon:yes gene_type:complete